MEGESVDHLIPTMMSECEHIFIVVFIFLRSLSGNQTAASASTP